MKTKLTILTILISGILTAQTNKLSFEIGTGISYYSMKNLNEFYIDNFAKKNKLLTSNINNGFHFYTNIKYQPSLLFDFGVYGSFQTGNSKGYPEFTETDDLGAEIQLHKGAFDLTTQAIGLGVSNSWYISKLLNFRQKENKFLQNFRIATEFNLGIGFSDVIANFIFNTYKLASDYSRFNTKDFQGQVALKFEYDFIKTPIISSIGLKIGYQYFKTNKVKDSNGNDWIVLDKSHIDLDFSGFFSSLYLSFGK